MSPAIADWLWPESDGTWVYLTLDGCCRNGAARGSARRCCTGPRVRIRRLGDRRASERKVRVRSERQQHRTARRRRSCCTKDITRPTRCWRWASTLPSPVPAPTALPAGIDVRPRASPDTICSIAASIHEAYQQRIRAGRFGEVFDAADRCRLSQPETRSHFVAGRVGWRRDCRPGPVGRRERQSRSVRGQRPAAWRRVDLPAR